MHDPSDATPHEKALAYLHELAAAGVNQQVREALWSAAVDLAETGTAPLDEALRNVTAAAAAQLQARRRGLPPSGLNRKARRTMAAQQRARQRARFREGEQGTRPHNLGGGS